MFKFTGLARSFVWEGFKIEKFCGVSFMKFFCDMNNVNVNEMTLQLIFLSELI